jgi:glutamine amidotransferase
MDSIVKFCYNSSQRNKPDMLNGLWETCMIGVIDSRICNIFSLTNMLKKLGGDYIITSDPGDIDKVDKLILPGVGAFPKAMQNFNDFGLTGPIRDFAASGKPVLGICLGMQLLFEESMEFTRTEGLGLIPGSVVKIKTEMVLPHMGWNDLKMTSDIPLLKGVEQGVDCYFVHTFRAKTSDQYIAATTEYGETVPAVVYNGSVYGTQFHPEKSRRWGEVILNNYINL